MSEDIPEDGSIVIIESEDIAELILGKKKLSKDDREFMEIGRLQAESS